MRTTAIQFSRPVMVATSLSAIKLSIRMVGRMCGSSRRMKREPSSGTKHLVGHPLIMAIRCSRPAMVATSLPVTHFHLGLVAVMSGLSRQTKMEPSSGTGRSVEHPVMKASQCSRPAMVATSLQALHIYSELATTVTSG